MLDASTSIAGYTLRSDSDKTKLHVAGALEFFEHRFIHSAIRFDERRRKDGQRAALFDISGSTEKSFRRQRTGVDTTREYDPAGAARL